MDPQLIDRIYESSFVPEHWPGVLDELGRIADGTGGTLFITKAGLQYWTASPGSLERAGRVVKEGWFFRGKAIARMLAARHAGFLTELDVFTLDELDQEPIVRDYFRPQGFSWFVATTIPIPTGENVLFIMPRWADCGPYERDIVQKLDEPRPTSPSAHFCRRACSSSGRSAQPKRLPSSACRRWSSMNKAKFSRRTI